MSTEEKFHAAVNVIRNLPKNGSYQPSHELMLRFYAYFKQATLGPCTSSRPGFWDPVGRYKYDAHKALGNMPREEAMRRYVEELHSIVETLSYSEGVKNFLETGENEIESINFSDLEKIAPDVLRRVRSQTNSPMISRDPSPTRAESETDHSDDEYSDTVEVIIKEHVDEPRHAVLVSNGIYYKTSSTFSHLNGGPAYPKTKVKAYSDDHNISVNVLETLENMTKEIDRLEKKMCLLEKQTKTNYSVLTNKIKLHRSVSITTIAFIVGWPLVVSLIVHKYLQSKRV